MVEDPRIGALPDSHGHAKGEHKPFAEERPIPYTARMLFLWFYHACRRGAPRFMMVADHINYLTFEDPAAVHVVRRALKLAQAGDLYGAAETAGVELGHASVVSEGLRRGMRYSIGAEIDNDPRSRPDAQNIVDAMKPDGLIRSVHFLPIVHPQHGENWMWAFDNPEFKEYYDIVGTDRVWELYMETLLDAIDKLPGHIVGHFYVPAKFGHWPDDATLEGYEDRLIDACAERGMAVEINTRYFYKYYAGDDAQLDKFRTVNLRLLRKAKAKGVMVSVGSDAHSPRDQGRAFDVVLEILDEAEINEIAFPLNDRLARVALRATEDILRQHSAALAALAAPAPAAARGGTPVDPADDDDDDSDRNDENEDVAAEPRPDTTRPEMSRTESRHDGAEIILPPGTEEHIAEEAAAAERAAREISRAEAAAAAKAEAAARPKPQPKPRKSRAKPKVAVAAADPVPEATETIPEASSAPVLAEASVAAVADAAETAAEAAALPEVQPVPDSTGAPAPRAVERAPRPKAKPPVKAAPRPAPPAKPTSPKNAPPPAKKAPAKKAAAPKKAPAKKAAPAAKKQAAAKKAPAVKKAPAKKGAPKKAAPKKVAAKKVPATRKASPVKRTAAAKRPAAKRPVAKKTAKKKSTRR